MPAIDISQTLLVPDSLKRKLEDCQVDCIVPFVHSDALKSVLLSIAREFPHITFMPCYLTESWYRIVLYHVPYIQISSLDYVPTSKPAGRFTGNYTLERIPRDYPLNRLETWLFRTIPVFRIETRLDHGILTRTFNKTTWSLYSHGLYFSYPHGLLDYLFKTVRNKLDTEFVGLPLVSSTSYGGFVPYTFFTNGIIEYLTLFWYNLSCENGCCQNTDRTKREYLRLVSETLRDYKQSLFSSEHPVYVSLESIKI